MGVEGSICGLKYYLERVHQLSFPPALDSLYPKFFDILRRTLGEWTSQSDQFASRAGAPPPPAETLFLTDWASMDPTHPHFELFRGLGVETAQSFERYYTPLAGARRIDTTRYRLPIPHGTAADVDLGLIRLCEHGGVQKAIALLTHPLKSSPSGGAISWGATVSNAIRSSFAILTNAFQNANAVEFSVFSLHDQRFYLYTTKHQSASAAQKYVPLLNGERWRQLDALRQGRDPDPAWPATSSSYDCGECTVRLVCPAWSRDAPLLPAP